MSGFGDDVDTAGCDGGQVWSWSQAACVFDNSSTSPTTTPVQVTPDQANALIAQVNRFMGSDVPAAYRLTGMAASSYPTNGTLTPDVAMAALILFQRRAADAYSSATDATTKAGAQMMIAQADSGFADPLGFVTSNIGPVTSTLTTYGDLHGVAKAQSTTTILGSSVDTTTIAIGAAVVAALWLFAR